jgi:phage terminase large subunit GpA-like protein
MAPPAPDGLPLEEWFSGELARIAAASGGGAGRSPSLLEWSQAIPEPKFGALNFDVFPFQKQMYEWSSDDPEGVVQKAAQVGMSAWMIRWAMYFPDTRGRTALYVFPADEQARKFSNTRIKPLIQQSKYLAERVSRQEVNNVHERRIGSGFFHLTGSQSQAALESIDADVLALDEYDYLVQAHIPFAEKRIEGPLSLGYITPHE